MKISDNTSVAMPMRNLISIVIAVGLGVWAYFGIVERLNQAETSIILIKEDVTNEVERLDGNILSLEEGDIANNTEFRIKWPRGEMGSLPADSEQYMLIEHISLQLEKLEEMIETGAAPYDQQQKLTLEFFGERIQKLETRIDEIKNGGK